MKAAAEQHGLPFVELKEINSASVIRLVPESWAASSCPISRAGLRVIMHDPLDFETIDKLRFVLNRDRGLAAQRNRSSRPSINTTAAIPDRVSRLDASELTDTAIDRRRRVGGKSG
jgi:type IV pilus assembly protein PilB